MVTNQIHTNSAVMSRSSVFEKNTGEGSGISLNPDEEPPPFPHSKAPTKASFPNVADFSAASERSRNFRDLNYSDISDEEWNNWQWQFRNRIRTLDELKRLFRLSNAEITALSQSTGSLPTAITPYYASLIDPDDPLQPVRRTVIPTMSELIVSSGEAEDPLNEEGDCVAPGLYHRYPDRVLFMVTNLCSVNCRYCTRSRAVGNDSGRLTHNDWDKAIEYISLHPEVRDVLISGGDPLTLPESGLEYLLKRLREIEHVEIIRIGTKVPMVLPQRITESLVSMLKQYHPLWISIHCTHPEEITAESAEACRRLADAGIPLESQTVLLKDVNNNVATLKSLFQKLLKMRVKPYYLYQCDPITGSAHFRTTVREGIEMIRGIRGFTSGYAVPHYVIDAPGGGGKIPVSPNYVHESDNGTLVLENYEGNFFEYPDSSLSKVRKN